MKKILIITLIVLLIVLCYKVINKEKYTREDILALTRKRIDYNNTYIKTDTTLMNVHTGKIVDEHIEELKFRDNIGIKFDDDVPVIWYVNYSSNLSMQYHPDEKTKIKSGTDLKKEHPQNRYINLIQETDYTYKFIAEEKYNNKECIVFEVKEELNRTRFWIDNNGIVQKIEFYTKENEPKKWIKYKIIHYETKFNELTDKDMDVSHMNGYTLIDVFGNPK